MSNSTTLIAVLENAPGIIIPLIREVPPQYLKRRPSPTKWSAHEHACHLSGSDGPFLARLDLMLSAPAPFIRSILNSPEVESGALLSVDLDEALDRYVRERASLVKRLKEQDYLRSMLSRRQLQGFVRRRVERKPNDWLGCDLL